MCFASPPYLGMALLWMKPRSRWLPVVVFSMGIVFSVYCLSWFGPAPVLE